MTLISSSERSGQNIAALSIKLRWILILITIMACGLVSSGASNLKFAGDYRVFFGADNPDYIANEQMQATFGKPDNIAFVVIPKDKQIYTKDTLTAVHTLTEKSWTLPYVSRVDSVTNFQNTTGLENDLIVEDLVLDPGKLDSAAIAKVKASALAEPLIRDFVVSQDGEATVVSATVQMPIDVPNVAIEAAKAARAIKAEVLASHPNLDIHITGVASLGAAFQEAGTRDSSTLIPAVYAFILIVMLLALRSLSAVFASLMVIALSTVFGMGIGGLTGVELTPISLAAPTIILTIAVADAIHLIAGVREKMRGGLEKKQAIIEATGLNFTPIGITSLTTVIGFLALNFSDSPPFHHLGNMSAAGIAMAWFLSVTFLPALLSLLPLKFKKKGDVRKTEVVERVAEIVIARPKAVAVSTLGVCLFAIAFIPTIDVNDQWSDYFGKELEFRQAIDASEPYFGSDTIEFVLNPGAPGAVTEPEFLRTIDNFSGWLRQQNNDVAHVFALSDIMKRLNSNLNADDPDFYAIPDQRKTASQYLFVYELSLPYGLDLNNRVDIDRQTTRVTATMKDISTNETKAFITKAENWFNVNGNGYDLEITGSKVLFAFVAQRNIDAVFQGALYLILAIFLILSLAFRSIKIGLISLVANALPILTAFGVWAILVGNVGFSIAAVGSVAVGLVVDFTVHFLAKYLRSRRDDNTSIEDAIRYAFRTAGSAIFLTTIILVAGFTVLVTSSFKLNADLGLLTAMAVIFAMLINFLLLPAILLIAGDRRHVPSPLHQMA